MDKWISSNLVKNLRKQQQNKLFINCLWPVETEDHVIRFGEDIRRLIVRNSKTKAKRNGINTIEHAKTPEEL